MLPKRARQSRKKQAPAFRCLIVSDGHPVLTVVDGEPHAGLTYFVYTYWFYDNNTEYGPDEETGVHILTAVTLVPLVDDAGKVSIDVIAETAGDRRKMEGDDAPGHDIGKEVARSVGPELVKNLPGELKPKVLKSLKKVFGNNLQVLPGTVICFSTPANGRPQPTDFSVLGVRKSFGLGGATAETAALVVTFFSNDIMIWRAIKDREGIASEDKYKSPWKRWTKDEETAINDLEDEKQHGRHMFTLYLPSKFQMNRLDDKQIKENTQGRNWNNLAASVWVQPGPRWNGESVLLTKDQLDTYDKNHTPGFKLATGFHDLLLVDKKHKDHILKSAVGLRVVGSK